MIKLALLAPALLALGCSSLEKSEAQPATAAPATAGKADAWSPAMESRRLALGITLTKTGISVVRNKDDQLQLNLPSDFAFSTDSAEIKPAMRPELDQLAEGLKTEATTPLLMHIVGYTDSKGSDAVNDRLSLARANRVRQHLESKGVAAGRITVEGRGEHQPLVGNEQSYGRALNRRVEIILREPAPAP